MLLFHLASLQLGLPSVSEAATAKIFRQGGQEGFLALKGIGETSRLAIWCCCGQQVSCWKGNSPSVAAVASTAGSCLRTPVPWQLWGCHSGDGDSLVNLYSIAC